MRCNFDKYIIWTLDITAILKYIEANYKEPIDEKIVISDKYFHVIWLCSEFPNKPYTTYTQEEKESLLEILKSLK